MKNIAVEGCTLDCVFAQISTPPTQSVKCMGKASYAGSLTIQISGYSSSVITVSGSGSGSGTLQGSARYVSIEGKEAVLEGDNVTITVKGQATSGTTTIPVEEQVTVTIISAGQTLVKGI